MQTITFTTDDDLYQLLDNIAKESNKSASEIITESIHCYAQILQNKKLQQQIKQASVLTANQSLFVNQLLEGSNADGL